MIIFSIVILFFLLTFNFLFWTSASESKGRDSENATLNKFSILIAAKNESRNLNRLFNSIKNLKYPREHYEIIFIDDNSTDNTLDVAREHAASLNNVIVLEAKQKEIPGKKGALQIAFNKASNPFIVTTDADCKLPPLWLTNINKLFNTNADLIIGFHSFENLNNTTKKYAAFESLKNQILTFSFANLGFPYSSIGTNFAFKKEILERIGGYSAISETLSGDDDLLLQKALMFKAKVKTLISKDSIVKTFPPENFKHLINQRSRHVSTSTYYSLQSRILLALWHFTNLIAFFSIFLAPINPTFYFLFIVKILLDLITVFKFQKKWNYKFRWGEIIIFQVIYELMIPVYFIKSQLGTIKWK